MLRLLLPLILLLALAAPAGALSAVTLDEAAATALAASPAMTAVDRALDAAQARARAAGAWPNPSFVSQLQLSPNAANNMVTVGVRQPLDFRDLAGQRRAHAEEDVAALLLTRTRLSRQVAHEARMAAVALGLAEARLSLHDHLVAHTEAELTRGRKRVAMGALAPHELLEVEFALADARQKRRAVSHEALRQRARLNLLWGRTADSPIALAPLAAAPAGPDRPLAAWIAEAESQRIEIQQAAIAARRDRRAAQLAESLRFGEGEIDLEAGTAANTDPLVYGAFVLPLPVHNASRDEASAHLAEAARQQAERLVAARTIAQEVADAYLETQLAAERVRGVDESLMPLAAHALARAEARVKAGAGLPEELIAARRHDLEARSARIQALLEYHQARLRLEAAAGR